MYFPSLQGFHGLYFHANVAQLINTRSEGCLSWIFVVIVSLTIDELLFIDGMLCAANTTEKKKTIPTAALVLYL